MFSMKNINNYLNKTIISFKKTNIKYWTLSLIIGVLLASGFTYAWNIKWHGTNWVGGGKVIKAREIAENFEYLKKKLDDTNTIINNYHNETNTSDCAASTFQEPGPERFYPKPLYGGQGSVKSDQINIICPGASNKEVVSCKLDISPFVAYGSATVYRLQKYKSQLTYTDGTAGTLTCSTNLHSDAHYITHINYQCVNGSFKYISSENVLCGPYTYTRESSGWFEGDCGGVNSGC